MTATAEGTRDGAAAIRAAGEAAMSEHGYHASSIRDIARRAGMSKANVYHHFRSKEDLLFQIMADGLDILLEETAAALARAAPDPVSQLCALVEIHVTGHAERRRSAFVAASELRNLPPARRRAIRAKMDHQQDTFDRIVGAGVDARVFATPHPAEASRAVSSMCTAVATWFKPRGPFSPAEVADQYAEFALALVRAR
jgi:AcrR family transcriptional regulator